LLIFLKIENAYFILYWITEIMTNGNSKKEPIRLMVVSVPTRVLIGVRISLYLINTINIVAFSRTLRTMTIKQYQPIILSVPQSTGD
jgi:hypothetical protein